MSVDLTTTKTLLADATQVAQQLDGDETHDSTVDAKSAAAATNRQLLNLADMLQLASSLVRNEYWGVRNGVSYDL